MSRQNIFKVIESLSHLGFKERAKAIEDMRLDESSLSRIWQHVEDNTKTFGVISAFRNENSKAENEEKHLILKKAVRDIGLGFIEMEGGYAEAKGKTVVIVKEKSLFIPNIKLKALIGLGKEYNQDSVIYKGTNEFRIVSTSPSVASVGSTLVDFNKGSGKKNLDLAKDAVKEFFSALLKGSHSGRKFVFTEKNTGECFFFVREMGNDSMQSHYYTDEPRWLYIYQEDILEEVSEK